MQAPYSQYKLMNTSLYTDYVLFMIQCLFTFLWEEAGVCAKYGLGNFRKGEEESFYVLSSDIYVHSSERFMYIAPFITTMIYSPRSQIKLIKIYRNQSHTANGKN